MLRSADIKREVDKFMENRQNYDDIIGLCRPYSKKHRPMSMLARAAQFAPFAALTGYESAVSETARLTDERIELDEDRKEILNMKLRMIADCPNAYEHRTTVTYFCPDKNKSGGAYISVTGLLRNIDEYERVVVMDDFTVISVDDIYDIESEITEIECNYDLFEKFS